MNLRISAVRYLNTWPLVWGFIHGPQQNIFDIRFDLPVDCAAAVGAGQADIGLVPCAELTPLGLDFLPDLGIATEGDVRSILLISRVPFPKIRTLAADSSSRTSVALARILLLERYGCAPAIARAAPHLRDMLDGSDAALVIGDPALRIDPSALPFQTLDLGGEWVRWTGLPMVFAVWAGRQGAFHGGVASVILASYHWGRSHFEEMIDRAKEERGFEPLLVREYLSRHIVYELGPKHQEGLRIFRELAADLKPLEPAAQPAAPV